MCRMTLVRRPAGIPVWGTLMVSVILAAVCGGPARAQHSAAPQSSPRPDGEAILRELELGRRPGAAVVPTPAGDRKARNVEAVIDLAGQRDPLLWPEDFQLSMRRGKIRKCSDGWEFVFAANEEGRVDGPVRLLPNSKLRQMVNHVQIAGQEADFAVTGRVTEYRGANHLLVRDVSLSNRVGEADQQPAKPSPAENGEESASTSSVMEQLAQSARSGRPLQEEPSSGVLMAGGAGSDAAGSVIGTGRAGRLLPEDARVENRPGRLVRDGSGWCLALETESDQPAEAALRLLPNLTLQRMEEQSGGGKRSVVFLVSGELTEYGGANYLLARQFVVRRPDVNFR